MRPETKYAKSGSVSIAYQVSGSGSVDLVIAPGTVSHLDLFWELPRNARWLERLGTFCRVIRFDKRGTGLSDRPTNAATLEERMDDIRAVMDAAGSDKAVIYGISEGGSMACAFAATYPARTIGLLLWGVQARWTRTDDYPWGLTRTELNAVVANLEENGVTMDYIVGPGAGVGKAAESAYLDWFLRYARAGGSPSAVAALERMNADIDTRDILPTIRVPTLVMNRTGDPVANVEAARDVAKRIPGAKFMEWPGATHGVLDIADQVAPVIQEFVTGMKSEPTADRVLATILFVDIVDSTAQVTQMGDAAWARLLSQFNALSEQTVTANRGRFVKSTGDGFLATFDGPTRAIRCARSLREASRGLGVGIRAGLHTGECEIIGADVGGVAVHLAARVVATASPEEILVSSTVKDLIAGSNLRLQERGMHMLKGFADERLLFAVE
jgi:class 3 adenylate cyclase